MKPIEFDSPSNVHISTVQGAFY